MTEGLEARLHELREQADRYAKAKADMEYLRHYRKSKLAMLMAEFAKSGLETVNAQDREARCHPDYIQVLEGLREATEVAEREGWHLRIAMQGASLWQTQQATLRAEMQTYNSKES